MPHICLVATTVEIPTNPSVGEHRREDGLLLMLSTVYRVMLVCDTARTCITVPQPQQMRLTLSRYHSLRKSDCYLD
jgi:hypothetical protein